jgi:hypothetical protein
MAARQSGLAAAWEQQKSSAQRKQAVKGAGIRQRLGGAVPGSTGVEMKQEAAAQLEGAKEERAQEYARRFDAGELEKMQNTKGIGKDQQEILGLAHQIRTGRFQAQQSADQQGVAGFQQLPEDLQARRINALTDKTAKSESPAVLNYLAETNDAPQADMLHNNLNSGALGGMLKQNNPEQIDALRKAHGNRRINERAIAGLSDSDKELYQHRIARAQEGLPPSSRGQGGSSSRPEINRSTPRVEDGAARPTERRSSGGVILPDHSDDQ